MATKTEVLFRVKFPCDIVLDWSQCGTVKDGLIHEAHAYAAGYKKAAWNAVGTDRWHGEVSVEDNCFVVVIHPGDGEYLFPDIWREVKDGI